MAWFYTRLVLLACMLALAFAPRPASAATDDLGNGFRHHGVATPVSNHRGTVATADASGRNVVLVWLFDRRGGCALLMIDAETGESEQFAMPFPPGGDCPYASILSSRSKFYTHFSSHFVEFDPHQRAFSFCKQERTPDGHGHDRGRQRPHLVSYLPEQWCRVVQSQDA